MNVVDIWTTGVKKKLFRQMVRVQKALVVRIFSFMESNTKLFSNKEQPGKLKLKPGMLDHACNHSPLGGQGGQIT